MNTEIQDTMQELQLAERSGDVGKMADLYGKLATMYFQAGETVTALGICQKNINMLEHTDNTAALAYAYLQKGELFDSHSTYSAEQCYKKALELFTKAGDKTGIGKTYYRLGENTDSHKAAVEYFTDTGFGHIRHLVASGFCQFLHPGGNTGIVAGSCLIQKAL